ncbi:MAG: hypothetical protein ACU0DW_08400 [Shimia sp.]
MTTTSNHERPPPNTRRVYGWDDLPNLTSPASYWIETEGRDRRRTTLAKHTRQTLEGLIRSPLFAASYCRLSDQVLKLKTDHGIDIECSMYRGDPETGRLRYGVYFLRSTVTPIADAEAA